MLQHIFKMMWNRKRANALIMFEIMIIFLILFSVISIGLHNFKLYRSPLGYNTENAWSLRVDMRRDWQAQDKQVVEYLIRALRNIPEVKSVHTLSTPPFFQARRWERVSYNGRIEGVGINEASDGAMEAFGVKLLEGRWYGRQDKGQAWIPVLINQHLKNTLFGNASAVGRNLHSEEPVDSIGYVAKPYKVVGVIEAFKQLGRLEEPFDFMVVRHDREQTPESFGSLQLIIKPGMEEAFEVQLQKMLQRLLPEWHFLIDPWERLDKRVSRGWLVPMLVFSILGAFFVLMVFVGMTGIMWQSVISRIQEIGLRRAVGASAASIRFQVVAEALTLSFFALCVGFLIAIQFPIAGLIESLTWALFLKSIGISAGVMFVLTSLCAFYPGLMASRYLPVEALHTE